MNRFKILRNILVAIALCVASLNGAAEVKYLVVNLNDGTSATFALADNPVITNSTSALQVTSAQKSIEVSFADLKNYQLTDNVSGISETGTSEESYRMLNDIIYFDGLNPGTQVSVFTLDGKLSARTDAAPDGNAIIDLSPLSSGVYIVAYNNKTIKFLIP